MPTFRNPFTRKDATRGSTPVDGRLAMAGLVTPAGDVGVTPGVVSGMVVSGRSTAPGWAYSVSGGHAVTTRSATDGANLTGLDGATDTPTVAAAPATGSRWDLIWIRQRDVDNGDPDSAAVLGVTSGPSSGTPSKPYGSVPAGALVLAEAQVSAGAATTADPLVTITQVATLVSGRGGIVPATSAEAARVAAFDGSARWNRTTKQLEIHNGTAWDDGGWTAFTPAMSQIILGSSTVVGRYRRSGKTVDVMLSVTLGAGFALNANMVGLTLPVPKSSTWPAGTICGVSSITDSGAGWLGPNIVRITASGVDLHGIYAGGHSWAVGDAFTASFRYEAA